MRVLNIFFFRIWVCFVTLFVCLSSCVKDDIREEASGKESGIRLNIKLPEPVEKKNLGSRARLVDFNIISDLNIIVAIGDKIENIYYFSSFEASNNGSVSLEPLGTDKATIEIMDLYPETADVYLVANYNTKISAETVSVLKSLKQEGTITGCMMYAKAEEDIQSGIPDKRTLSARLKRTVAMVSVVLKDDGLASGVEIEPKRISLHNVPKTCMLGNDNVADENNIEIDGEWANIPTWGILRQGTSSVGSHDRNNEEDANFEPLFLFENLQGTDNNIVEEEKKGTDNHKHASYIQIDAQYYSREKNVYGPVTFKFCLGENVINNFDVRRNTHYMVTLKLKNYVVTEGGEIESDGTLKPEKSDQTWRVETDLDDVSFTSNVNAVNQSGGFIYLNVDGDKNKKWWLKSSNSDYLQGVWMWSPVDNDWISVAEGREIQSTNGAIPIFVEGADPEVDWIPGSDDIEVFVIGLYDKKPNSSDKPVKQLEVTRYPFKKVKLLTNGKEQEFYIDAVDREPLAWGYEDIVFEDTNNPESNGMQGFTITRLLIENYKEASLRYMPYGTSYGNGSAMMAASFLDLYPNGNGAGGDFKPSWAPDQAPQELPDVTNNTSRKYFYTIPSIGQWQAIEKQMNDIGIGPTPSSDCSLKPYVQYWTANHATTGFNPESGKLYSYTYEINRGYDKIQVGQPYYSYALRTKMLPYRCIVVRNPNYKQ